MTADQPNLTQRFAEAFRKAAVECTPECGPEGCVCDITVAEEAGNTVFACGVPDAFAEIAAGVEQAEIDRLKGDVDYLLGAQGALLKQRNAAIKRAEAAEAEIARLRALHQQIGDL